MSFHCAKCGKEQGISKASVVGRRDSCAGCGADLHACLQCNFYDPKAYNECREPQADRVVQKDRSNFCDYFTPREGAGPRAVNSGKEDHLKALDDLFKK